MTIQENAPLGDPKFEGFAVRVAPNVPNPLARASEVVQSVLGSEWRVEPLSEELRAAAPANSFDVLPAGAPALASGAAWQASYEIAASADIAYAEPIFETDVAGDAATPASEVLDLQMFGATANSDDFSWSLCLIDVPQAWKRTPPTGGAQFGEGILVGHPDTGYVDHEELVPGLQDHLGRNFVEAGQSAKHSDGGHGTGTASVIMSSDNRTLVPRSVTGVAPKAMLIPYRVAKKRPVVPVPVLFRSGMRRLRDAILAAIVDKCHVISISLGWLPHTAVHEAIVEAVKQNIIVLAAAGNYTYKLVVWPARYKEVIALAACDAQRRPWKHSARGSSVDFTAPGHLIWRADTAKYIDQTSGTSHATATTAGLAALWLGFWGRQALLQKYQNHVPLSEVFRWVLKKSADPAPSVEHWGHGIVNADKCLGQALPSVDEVRQSELESFGAEPIGETTLVDAFDFLPPHDARMRLAELLQVPRARVDQVSHGREGELIFAIATNAEASRFMSNEEPEGLDAFGSAPQLMGTSSSLESAIIRARESGPM
jgi:subtilisin family serine protease